MASPVCQNGAGPEFTNNPVQNYIFLPVFQKRKSAAFTKLDVVNDVYQFSRLIFWEEVKHVCVWVFLSLKIE